MDKDHKMKNTNAKSKAVAIKMSKKYPAQPAGYERRVRQLEKEGLDRGDAQSAADVEFRKKGFK